MRNVPLRLQVSSFRAAWLTLRARQVALVDYRQSRSGWLAACVLGALFIALDRAPLALSFVLIAVGILFKESAYATPHPSVAVAFYMLRDPVFGIDR